MELKDRRGFLCDVTRVISEADVNITDVSLEKASKFNGAKLKMRLFELEVHNYEQLDSIMRKISKIEGVVKVVVVN